MKKIMFTGGGTGGHIVPNIALIEKLKDKYDCQYIGSKNSMEESMIADMCKFHAITTCKLKRSLSLGNLLIPFKLAKGIFDAKKILKREKPNVVFSKGGYVSLPVVIASKMLKIPVIAHESDLTMGLANKIALRYTDYVCTSFKDTAKNLKNGVYTGSPIRQDIFNGNARKVFAKHKLDLNLPVLLVVGGSLGSKNINQIILNNVKTLAKKYNILHITGKSEIENPNVKNYYIIKSTNHIQDYFCASDVVVTRGGSNVLFELLALKKPMLIIPLEKGSRGDQIDNAKWFCKHGYANMLMENEIADNSALLETNIDKTYKQKSELKKAMQNANVVGTDKIISLIEKYL